MYCFGFDNVASGRAAATFRA
jgi:hypothetical protein